jgi:hypothetical protein
MALFTISAQLDGFPFTVAFEGKAADISTYLDALVEAGATPPAPVAQPAAAPGQPAGGPPVCKFHGAMAPSTKVSGGWYCKAKMGDGSYCKETA